MKITKLVVMAWILVTFLLISPLVATSWADPDDDRMTLDISTVVSEMR